MNMFLLLDTRFRKAPERHFKKPVFLLDYTDTKKHRKQVDTRDESSSTEMLMKQQSVEY